MKNAHKNRQIKRFSKKMVFLHGKDRWLSQRIIHKSLFLIGQIPILKYGLKTLFLLFNIYM